MGTAIRPTKPALSAEPTVERSDGPQAEPTAPDAVPQPAEGIDLIGEYEASGYRRPPSLVRRRDGQTVQLTPLLFAALDAIDGSRNVDQIAEVVSEKAGRGVSADNIRYLIDRRLRPAGLVKAPDGSEADIERSNPLLALKLRVVLAGERLTNRVTAPFTILFHPLVVTIMLALFAAGVVWLLVVHGVAGSTRDLLYSPGLLLAVFGLTILSAGFHEFGHAAACRYSGGRPGVMGAGLYLMWPAFYTDVTDAYRLNRSGRLRTDLGGLYFNAIFAVATFAVWAVTRADALLLLIPLQLIQMVHQLMPFVRLDGYHILADLCGVPDLFARIKPAMLSLIPGHEADDAVTALKPWVRVVVTVWVLLVVPLLLFSFAMILISLPRVLATAWDSLGVQWGRVGNAFGDGQILSGIAGTLSIVALLLPICGSVYILVRTTRQLGRVAWSKADRFSWGRPVLATAAFIGVVALAWLWWPNGEYRPLQPGERGTLAEGVQQIREIPTGRPGLTDQRALELNGAPGLAETERTRPADGGTGTGGTPVGEAPAGTPGLSPSTTTPNNGVTTTTVVGGPAPTTAPSPTTTASSNPSTTAFTSTTTPSPSTSAAAPAGPTTTDASTASTTTTSTMNP